MNGGWSAGNGGAIAVSNAAVTLVNSVVSNSGAKELGGGIYALDSDLTLIDSVVSANATGIVSQPTQPDETGAEVRTATPATMMARRKRLKLKMPSSARKWSQQKSPRR